MEADTLANDVDIDILQKLNRDYIKSVQLSDVRRFDEILADDFLNSNPDGSLVDRAGFLAQIAPPATISNFEAHDVRIRRIGDVAIIHGRTHRIWARRLGRWLCVAAHVTRG